MRPAFDKTKTLTISWKSGFFALLTDCARLRCILQTGTQETALSRAALHKNCVSVLSSQSLPSQPANAMLRRGLDESQDTRHGFEPPPPMCFCANLMFSLTSAWRRDADCLLATRTSARFALRRLRRAPCKLHAFDAQSCFHETSSSHISAEPTEPTEVLHCMRDTRGRKEASSATLHLTHEGEWRRIYRHAGARRQSFSAGT